MICNATTDTPAAISTLMPEQFATGWVTTATHAVAVAAMEGELVLAWLKAKPKKKTGGCGGGSGIGISGMEGSLLAGSPSISCGAVAT